VADGGSTTSEVPPTTADDRRGSQKGGMNSSVNYMNSDRDDELD
jgi:hypothetical protein